MSQVPTIDSYIPKEFFTSTAFKKLGGAVGGTFVFTHGTYSFLKNFSDAILCHYEVYCLTVAFVFSQILVFTFLAGGLKTLNWKKFLIVMLNGMLAFVTIITSQDIYSSVASNNNMDDPACYTSSIIPFIDARPWLPSKEMREEISELKAEKMQLKNQLVLLDSKSLETENDLIAELKLTNERLQQKITTDSIAYAGLMNTMSQTGDKKIQELTKMITDLQGRNNELDSTVTTITTNISGLQTDLNDCLQAKVGLEKDLANKSQFLINCRTDSSSLKTQLTDCNKEKLKMEGQLKDSDDLIRDLRKEIKKLNTTITELKNSLKPINVQPDNSGADCKTEVYKTLYKPSLTIRNELYVLEAKYDSLYYTYSQISDKVKTSLKLNDHTRYNYQNLNTQANKIVAEIEALKK